jgi:hypothetical protein
MGEKARPAVPDVPPISTVFRGENGMLHHTRCGGVLNLQGSRGGIELDFYCFACPAHVTIPDVALARIPVLSGPGAQLVPRHLARFEEIDEIDEIDEIEE